MSGNREKSEPHSVTPENESGEPLLLLLLSTGHWACMATAGAGHGSCCLALLELLAWQLVAATRITERFPVLWVTGPWFEVSGWVSHCCPTARSWSTPWFQRGWKSKHLTIWIALEEVTSFFPLTFSWWVVLQTGRGLDAGRPQFDHTWATHIFQRHSSETFNFPSCWHLVFC